MAGSQTCSAGNWGSCEGEVVPATEICDGQDNDCNAETDELDECECAAGDTQPCGSDVGECALGTQTCNAQFRWDDCSDDVGPTAEICDDNDNNCNGATDEGLTQNCYTGPEGTQDVGICEGGLATCSEGSWGACDGEITPQDETPWDWVDQDCDSSDDVLGASFEIASDLDPVAVDLAYNGTDYFVVWEGRSVLGDNIIVGRLVLGDGTLSPTTVLVTSEGRPSHPSVASDGADFFVTWVSTLDSGNYYVAANGIDGSNGDQLFGGGHNRNARGSQSLVARRRCF